MTVSNHWGKVTITINGKKMEVENFSFDMAKKKDYTVLVRWVNGRLKEIWVPAERGG